MIICLDSAIEERAYEMNKPRIVLLEQFNANCLGPVMYNGMKFVDPIGKVPGWRDSGHYSEAAVRLIRWNMDEHRVEGGEQPSIVVKNLVGRPGKWLTLFEAWFDANGELHRENDEPAVVKGCAGYGPWAEYYTHGIFDTRIEVKTKSARPIERGDWLYENAGGPLDCYADFCLSFERN